MADRLEKLEVLLIHECENIGKSINNTKTLAKVLEKKLQIREWVAEYELTIIKLSDTFSKKAYSRYLKTQNDLRARRDKALLILDSSKISDYNKCKIPRCPSDIDIFSNLDEKQLSPGTPKFQGVNLLAVPSLSLTGNNKSLQDLTKSKIEVDIVALKMAAYIFPMQTAVQCIPEFTGKAEEIDAFIAQIEFFYNQIPEPQPAAGAREPTEEEIRKRAEREGYLLNVVIMKLKGSASKLSRKLKGNTWEETKENLVREFSKAKSMEELAKEIETLEQKPKESFDEYKERALTIKSNIDLATEEDGFGSQYAERTLKIHFLAGLRNTHLKQLGTTYRNRSFEELVQYLKEECEGCEHVVDIERRLKSMHGNQDHRENYNSNDNYQENNGRNNYRGRGRYQPRGNNFDNRNYGGNNNQNYRNDNYNNDRNRNQQQPNENSRQNYNQNHNNNNYQSQGTGNYRSEPQPQSQNVRPQNTQAERIYEQDMYRAGPSGTNNPSIPKN